MHDAEVIAVIPPPALSAAGAHAEPFHFSTWPEAAQPAAIFEGAIQAAIFASVTEEAARSADQTERSVISADQTADFEAREPRAEIWEETVAIPEVAVESWESRRFTFETILFHSEEESWAQPETVAMGVTET